MKILLIGSTGMAGQSLIKEAKKRKINIVGMARNGADVNLDITDTAVLKDALFDIKPDVIINTAAVVSLDACEQAPGEAYAINSKVVSILAEFCKRQKNSLIHISTDHYYFGDGNKKHTEKDNVYLLNEYARTKYAGECFALSYENSLVIRTNIVGFRGKQGQPTFVEWIINALKHQQSLVLFHDFFTSSIHVRQFAKVVFDLLIQQCTGILNISSRDVFSKQEFILALAGKLGYADINYKVGSIHSLEGVKRADSLGLDVSQAEKLLGYTMPSFADVIDSTIDEYEREWKSHEL